MTSLSKQPDTRVETLADLVGIASSIESEAVRRYGWLAAEMRRRDEWATAEAFDVLASEEQNHVAAVESWARDLGETLPEPGPFRWRLPTDLASTWEEAAGSALLTPYRAYSIAVDSEERAFAFYVYLAASADDPRIAREAELLAKEELRHAATLRAWRRIAWRRERRHETPRQPTPDVTSRAELEPLIACHEAEIAACHRTLSDRLRGLKDTEGADFLARLARDAGKRAGAAASGECGAEACTAEHPLGLLMAAQKPLERLAEVLETLLLTTAEEETRAEVERAMESVVARIAQIGRRIEQLETT